MGDDLMMGIAAVAEKAVWLLLWALAIAFFPVTIPLWLIGRKARKAGYELRY